MVENVVKLQAYLRRQSLAMGAEFFGVADLALAEEAIIDQGGEFLARFPYAVSVGIILADGIVDELHQHDNRRVLETYRFHVYEKSGRLGQMLFVVLETTFVNQRNELVGLLRHTSIYY